MGKQSICLSMIVKNEGRVIRRCLESVRPLIDSWAIVDTGSTDDTRDVIREVLSGVPGELQSAVPEKRRWWQRARSFDFAKHRNIALESARALGTDFILVIDADEEIKLGDGADGTFPELTASRYVANFRMVPDARRWHRTLLVRASDPWHYRFPIHEVLHCEGAGKENFQALILEGLEVLSYSDGARNQDKEAKFRRDAIACKAAIRADPTEPRHWYYLGQSWGGAGEFLKALRAYEKRATMEGWDEERWYALYQIAPLKEILGYHWRDVLQAYLTAFNARPWRAEPLWAAGILCTDHGEPALGEMYLRRAAGLPYPPDSFLIREDIYHWRAADDLAGCLAKLGRKDDCIGVLKAMLSSPTVPDSEHARLSGNLELAHQQP